MRPKKALGVAKPLAWRPEGGPGEPRHERQACDGGPPGRFGPPNGSLGNCHLDSAAMRGLHGTSAPPFPKFATGGYSQAERQDMTNLAKVLQSSSG